MNKAIPLYKQIAQAVGGIYVIKLTVEDLTRHIETLGTHRDDFFVFFVLTRGKVIMTCDTETIEMKALSVGLIKPFQIHSNNYISPDSEGFYISAEPFLIPDDCSAIFQTIRTDKQVTPLDSSSKTEILDTISLLLRSFNTEQSNKSFIINALFHSLIYRFANLYPHSGHMVSGFKNQAWILTSNFKRLLSQHFLKSPSFLASQLNVSTSYLNECVNATTGKSVTYWLQNTMVMEAQRQLYYTDNDVKEIAFDLGFEDHSYFCRVFKKITKQTPLAFRKKFRS